MQFYVGTSGYSYKEWKGTFYPEDAKPQDMLRLYAERLSAVEINNTFYRMPSEKMLLGWAEQVPDGFSFALKASRRITHHQRLRDSGDSLRYLLQTSGVLGEKLGPMLFQLPPNLSKDTPRLAEFLALLPNRWPVAFEFRHSSWFADDVYDALRSRGAALVVADTNDVDSPALVPTAGFGYLRLRREQYDDDQLGRWVARIAEQPWEKTWIFFKHEDEGAGPWLAARFNEHAERAGVGR
jgi:uncharacterized protein YecE (DUF72 family)